VKTSQDDFGENIREARTRVLSGKQMKGSRGKRRRGCDGEERPSRDAAGEFATNSPRHEKKGKGGSLDTTTTGKRVEIMAATLASGVADNPLQRGRNRAIAGTDLRRR